MRELLKSLKGARVIAKGQEKDGREIVHYLLPSKKVVEVVVRKRAA